MMPLVPRIARQMMIRDGASRKNGIVNSVITTAFSVLERQPLASQSANGNAIRNSITVIVNTTRNVRRAAIQRPDSISETQVLKVGS